jgi:hypothetical protein
VPNLPWLGVGRHGGMLPQAKNSKLPASLKLAGSSDPRRRVPFS